MTDKELELKTLYNKLLERCNTASKMMDDPDISIARKDLSMDKYLDLEKQYNSIIRQFQKEGIEYTSKDLANGFKLK